MIDGSKESGKDVLPDQAARMHSCPCCKRLGDADGGLVGDNRPDQVVCFVAGQIVSEDQWRRHDAPSPEVCAILFERCQISHLHVRGAQHSGPRGSTSGNPPPPPTHTTRRRAGCGGGAGVLRSGCGGGGRKEQAQNYVARLRLRASVHAPRTSRSELSVRRGGLGELRSARAAYLEHIRIRPTPRTGSDLRAVVPRLVLDHRLQIVHG